MSFTEHLKDLQLSDLPKPLLDELASALRFEMKRSKLLDKPPSYFGYIDWTSWKEPLAFQELLFDCYMDTVLNKLKALQGYIELGQNIDGLIFQNIQWFITGKMREQDPVGYAVFQNVKGAIKCAIKRDVIRSNDEPKRINNNTLLIFSSSTTPSNKDLIYEALCKNSVWTKELQLKLSKQRNLDKVKDSFCNLICELKKSGISSFLVKDLVDVIKDEVRQIVEELEIIDRTHPDNIDKTKIQGNSEDDEEAAVVLFTVSDDADYYLFREYCHHIRKAIDKFKVKPNVRKELHKIFTEIEVPIKGRANHPSQADIARNLDFDASKVSKLMKQLRELVKQILKPNDFE